MRCIVITGAGKAFCGGGDVKDFTQTLPRIGVLLKELTTFIHGAVSRLVRTPKPVITAVNGVAAGGGLALALAGDLVRRRQWPGSPMAYSRIGPRRRVLDLLAPRLCGVRRAVELLLHEPASSPRRKPWSGGSRRGRCPTRSSPPPCARWRRSSPRGRRWPSGEASGSCTSRRPRASRRRWSRRARRSRRAAARRTSRRVCGRSPRSAPDLPRALARARPARVAVRPPLAPPGLTVVGAGPRRQPPASSSRRTSVRCS